MPTPPIILQKSYLQIHIKIASIKEKLVNELIQSNFFLNRLAAHAFRVPEAARAMRINEV
ncbi:hypothetical protein NTGBS_510023 [Candidatus Nitrotoga sp. BS]|uniref:hypothetical protein n=1 Tax=Candidatus Nitrotoga sp. BS TaxID=2890408 RepID=UPI001EF1C922|nr:hypothetical protein [Candidatus Nitrotoga sp. BS]CAH1204064.1 hypothetical protein NTGBS_510023 [Candidatus Nitrotoga sp. BS]